MIDAINQKQCFIDGYAKGSASVAEAKNAIDEEHAAFGILSSIIKNKQS